MVKYLQKSSQSFQLFCGICIFQLFLPCCIYRPHRLRMLEDDHAAALALGQGTQGAEITASEQNGTSQPLRAVLGTKAQPKDGPFFFVQRLEIAHHRLEAFFPQERLIPGQEDASRKAGQL